MAKRKTPVAPKTRAKAKPKTVTPSEIVESDGLTIKQRLFINHYLVCMNASEAARLAGYEGDSAQLAVVGSQNLRKVNILRVIDSRLNAFTMNANEVLIRLTDIARGDIGDALNSVGGIDPLEAKRRGKSHLIKKFKTKTQTTIGKTEKDTDTEVFEAEIEMYDAQAALTTLLKFHGLLVDRVKVEDWRTDIIALLKEGKVSPEQVRDELGDELAQELFNASEIRRIDAGEGR